MSTIGRAFEIAERVHCGQKDLGDLPYLLHVVAVFLQMETFEGKVVALLHDVVEDGGITLQDLRDDGFSKEIIEAVDVLTRNSQMEYGDYIRRVSRYPLARKVKIADLRHNLDPLRVSRIKGYQGGRVNKYTDALRMLINEDKP